MKYIYLFLAVLFCMCMSASAQNLLSEDFETRTTILIEPATMMLAYENDHKVESQGSGSELVGENVTFAAGSVVKNMTLSDEAKTVSGVVTDAETGEPMVYVQVMMQSGATMFMGMTNNQGQYSFEVTEPSLVYTLSASYYGYQTYKEENVSVADGNIVRDIALEKLTISGVVTDAKTDEPLAGARVMLSDSWWTEEEVTTDENGAYAFVIGDDTAEYSLTVSLEGYNEFEKTGIMFTEGSIVENIALEPIAPTVSGVVTDAETGEPMAYVQVMMQSGGTMFMGMTDIQGKYSFEVSEPDLVYTLSASYYGYQTYKEENVSVADGNIVRDIALEKLTISGVVTDAKTNEPLAGARVMLYDGWWTEVEVTTDENGAYAFVIGDDTAEYSLTVSLEGYNEFEKTGIMFTEGSIVENIALEPILPTVSGVVTDAETGEPMAHVQVMMQSGWTMFMGMTDEEGHYSFEVTETDLVYTLSAGLYGYQTYEEENVSVAEGDIVRNIALERLTIKGVVTDANTNEPLSGVRVVLFDGWWTEEEVTTDESGAYMFKIGDDAAEYTLTATLDGYKEFEKTGILFKEGSIVEDIALEPIVPTVSGVVTDAETKAPLEGVQVMMQSGGVIFFDMTDAEGHYSFEVSETGLTYTLTAYIAGYKTYEEENVSVAEGDVVRDIALEKLTISGIVTDSETNMPLAGVRVVLTDDWFSEWEVTTDESGAYSFEIADDSMEYAVTASLEGYKSFEKTGVIFDEGSVVLDIALEQISGVGVVTVDGLYVKGVNNAIEVVAPGKAIVSVYDLSGRLIRSVEVNEGKTLIEGLMEGIYIVNHVKVFVK